ncbi:MAG: hypothetical protein IAG13_31655 [Deltaproteobacteria bacterium]|nr:hypothetical protein [Nannocystaceae bacterium]
MAGWQEFGEPGPSSPTHRAPARLGTAPTTPAVPSASTLAEEIALLDDARAQLARGRDDAALAVLDRYTARFRDGKLHNEASKVRVRALCSAGREREAIAHARSASLPPPQCSS